MPPELYPHQEEAVSKLGNGKVLVGGVGTGKSITAVAYYVRTESPRPIYVITTAKKRNSLDWEKEFAAFAIGKTEDSTVAGVLTVDSWNNIGRYTHVRDAFFIFDEQRAVGSGAWADAIVKIARANRWVMLSATPGDTWLDFVPLFLANGFYKNRTEFIREHVQYNRFAKYPKVDRYHGVGKLVRYKAQLLVEMPYERHTKRIVNEVVVQHDAEALERVTKGRWHIFEERPIRDVGELFIVSRKLVNSDPSRLECVRALMEQHPRLIVFYNFDYELEMLRTLGSSPQSSTTSSTAPIQMTSDKRSTTATSQLSFSTSASRTSSRSTAASDESTSDTSPEWKDGTQTSSSTTRSTTATGSSSSSTGSDSTTSSGETSFAIAEWNGHKHQEVPSTDRWVYLVQYTAGAEGWNCITTDTIVFYSLTYSYKAWHQAFGRIDRLNTPFTELQYYVLQSDSWIDQAVRRSLKDKKNFNENRYSLPRTAQAA